MMRKKQLIAGGMLAVMVFGRILGSVSLVGAEETKDITTNNFFNKEGLWLTEIYQNDVDRSIKNNTREKNNYESINLYNSTTDLMEFIEITSTYNVPIKLNEMYEVYYNDTLLTITDMNDNSDITIQPNESIVLWNYRSDVETGIPTEQEFRTDMRVPEDAAVLKVTCGVNWAVTSSFTLKTKADGRIISTYQATDKVDTADGFSVELRIPDIGNEMEVYQAMNQPSAGYVYSGQLNGLVNTKVPDSTYAKGVYITEIRPNDVNRSGIYGSTSDLMECLEIVNTTDNDVDLNNDYKLMYMVKEGSRKVLTLYHYDETSESHVGTSEGCIIPAGKTAAIWCYRKNTLTDYTAYPTEQEFRNTYGVSDDVPVYIFTNQNGLNNTNRGLELYEVQENGTNKLVSNYCYNGTTDLKDNRSVDLMVNPEGPEMLIYAPNAVSSIGTVKEQQYTYLKDDGSSLVLRLDSEVPESIMQGEEIRVNFYYDVQGNLPRTGITTYYRFDGTGKWYSNTEVSRRVPHLYETMISADQLFSHDYVEFYVSADNRYHSTVSDIYKVRINKLNEVDGIRTNISDGEEVSGIISVTANDGGDNSNSKIYIDGAEYPTMPMLEHGAYFTFDAEERDSYFQNAITTTNDEIIKMIVKWQYSTLNGQAVLIDNHYFTYNKEKNSYDITLRFWAGTCGASINEYLIPDANREDFTVTELALRLVNGNTYYPVLIGPDDAATSKKTNLSTEYSAIHSIGDSAGWCPYMDVSFSVPADEVTAVGTEIDTTKLPDGEHILTVTDGTSTKEVKFIVDNTPPEITLGIEDGCDLTGKITFNPQTADTNTLETVLVTLDEEQIDIPYETTAYNLLEGSHILMVYAKDAAGNESVKTAAFTVSNAAIAVREAQAADITENSATLYLTLENSVSNTNAVFYKAEQVNTDNITTNTESGILPYIQYTINVGNVKEDDIIVANWDGTASNSDETHASTMFVLNTENGTWDKIAQADENGSIKEASFTAANHVKDGNATVIVQCTADSALPDLNNKTDGVLNTNENWDGTGVPQDYDFCIAWETDTQYYAEEWQYHYLNMNQWIVDKAKELNIKYVVHTGDIVDDYDMIYEWENADEAMRIFDDAGMAYGVLGGNHDVAGGAKNYENYYRYFGEERFKSQPAYGGSYQNNKGHYDLISENGQDLIIIYMSWDIYQEELDWMNEVLQKYSDRKAILCFHTYTNVKYKAESLLDYFGEMVQKYVVAQNPNVIAVLNGHYHGSSYETAMFDDDGDGKYDRTVYQICTDYQSGFEGGSEYIKFLYFDIDNNKIYMNSYSPYLDDFNFYDTETAILNVEGASATGVDAMVLDVEFNTDEQSILEKQFTAYLCTNEELGTAAADTGTDTIKLKLNNLDEQTKYVWYAVITNENTGYLKTNLYEFTTLSKEPEKPGNPETPKEPEKPQETRQPEELGEPDSKAVDVGKGTVSQTNVKTGDESPVWLFVLLGTSAVLAGGAIVFIKRKKEDKDINEA